MKQRMQILTTLFLLFTTLQQNVYARRHKKSIPISPLPFPPYATEVSQRPAGTGYPDTATSVPYVFQPPPIEYPTTPMNNVEHGSMGTVATNPQTAQTAGTGYPDISRSPSSPNQNKQPMDAMAMNTMDTENPQIAANINPESAITINPNNITDNGSKVEDWNWLGIHAKEVVKKALFHISQMTYGTLGKTSKTQTSSLPDQNIKTKSLGDISTNNEESGQQQDKNKESKIQRPYQSMGMDDSDSLLLRAGIPSAQKVAGTGLGEYQPYPQNTSPGNPNNPNTSTKAVQSVKIDTGNTLGNNDTSPRFKTPIAAGFLETTETTETRKHKSTIKNNPTIPKEALGIPAAVSFKNPEVIKNTKEKIPKEALGIPAAVSFKNPEVIKNTTEVAPMDIYRKNIEDGVAPKMRLRATENKLKTTKIENKSLNQNLFNYGNSFGNGNVNSFGTSFGNGNTPNFKGLSSLYPQSSHKDVQVPELYPQSERMHKDVQVPELYPRSERMHKDVQVPELYPQSESMNKDVQVSQDIINLEQTDDAWMKRRRAELGLPGGPITSDTSSNILAENEMLSQMQQNMADTQILPMNNIVSSQKGAGTGIGEFHQNVPGMNDAVDFMGAMQQQHEMNDAFGSSGAIQQPGIEAELASLTNQEFMLEQQKSILYQRQKQLETARIHRDITTARNEVNNVLANFPIITHDYKFGNFQFDSKLQQIKSLIHRVYDLKRFIFHRTKDLNRWTGMVPNSIVPTPKKDTKSEEKENKALDTEEKETLKGYEDLVKKAKTQTKREIELTTKLMGEIQSLGAPGPGGNGIAKKKTKKASKESKNEAKSEKEESNKEETEGDTSEGETNKGEKPNYNNG